MAAAYNATIELTDDESFGFAVSIEQKEDGDSLPLDEYEFEYQMEGCGVSLFLDQTSGVSVDLENEIVSVDPGADRRFRPGQYRHGFRAKHLQSGKVVQLFDGVVTVSEGNFR